MKEKYKGNVNRGVNCERYDEYGVPIPEYLDDLSHTGPLSLEIEGGIAEAD